MTLKTKVRAGGTKTQHNAGALKVKTKVRAGGTPVRGYETNHNQALLRAR